MLVPWPAAAETAFRTREHPLERRLQIGDDLTVGIIELDQTIQHLFAQLVGQMFQQVR
jgi:hypothetical protein